MNFIRVISLSLLALAAFAPGAGAVPFVARHSHSVTLLPDGNFLVTGGINTAGAQTASVQFYNMATSNFVNWADLTTARSSHTATLMSDGNVLIAGGFNAGVPLSSLEVCYSTSAQCGPVTATLSEPRGGHTATLLTHGLHSGKVLICGGQTGSNPPVITADCDLFNPASPAAIDGTDIDMHSPRMGHTATLLKGGKVLVTGGKSWLSGAWLYEPMTELFDPATGLNRWVPKDPLLQGRINHSATVLNNGLVLIAGGFNEDTTYRCFNEIGEECWTAEDAEAWGYTNGHILHGMGTHGYMDGAEFFNQDGGRAVLAEREYGVAPYRVDQHSAVLLPDGSLSMHGGIGNIVRSNVSASLKFIPGATFTLSPTATAGVADITGGIPTLELETTLARPISGILTDSEAFFAKPEDPEENPSVSFSLSNLYLNHSNATLDGLKVGAHINADPGCPVKASDVHVPGDFHSSITLDAPTGTAEFSPVNLVSNSDVDNTAAVINSAAVDDFTITTSTDPPENVNATINVTLGMDLPWYYDGIRGSIEFQSLTITDPTETYSFSVNSVDDIDPLPTAPLTAVYCNADAETCRFELTVPLTVNGDISNLSEAALTDEIVEAAMPGDPLSAAYELTFTADNITVKDADTAFEYSRAHIVIREMLFSNGVNYSPKDNSWSDLTDPEQTPELISPVFNHTAILTPAADTFVFGGRRCTGQPDCGNRTFTAYGGGTVIVPVYRSELGDGDWTTGSELASKRAFHTSTLLPDGSILTCGGSDGARPLATCERMDPATREWSPTGSMNYARSRHTATLLPNGNVLVAGGATPSSAAVSTAEIYYPDTQTWVLTAPMDEPRINHTATLLSNGNVLVAAGSNYDGYSNTTEVFITSNSYWVNGQNIGTRRQKHTATLLKTGNVLLAGGVNADGPVRATEEFNPVTLAPVGGPAVLLNTGRYDHTATLLRDGRVLVVGGSNSLISKQTSEIYNGTTWTEIPDLLTYDRASHRAVLLPNGKVMVTGGETPGSAQRRAESFDPDFYDLGDIEAWSDQGLHANRAHHTTVVMADNHIMNIGGWDGFEYLKTTDMAYFSYFPDMEGLAADIPRQPEISTVTARFNRSDSLTLLSNTSNFHGISEASGGGAGPMNSSFHNPRIYIQQIDNPSGFMLDLSSRIYTGFGGINSSWQATLSSITITAPDTESALPHGFYHLRVAAGGVFSDAVTIQVSTPRPTVTPSVPSAQVHGTSSITWTWNLGGGALSGAEGYILFSASNSVVITTVAFTESASYTQTGLPPNTEASLMVAAYNLGGIGPVSVSTVAYTHATTPTGLVIRSASFETAELEWSANGNSDSTAYEVTEYLVEGTVYTTPVMFSANHTSTETVVGNLTANLEYSFRVRARNGEGIVTGYSDYASTTTVSSVSSFRGSPISSSTIKWEWVPALGSTGYEIYDTEFSTLTPIGTPAGATASWLQTGLAANTEYSAMIRAYRNTLGGPIYGPVSGVHSVYTHAVQPAVLPAAQTFSASGLSTGSIAVAWLNPDNANSTTTVYRVTIAPAPASSSAAATAATINTQYTFTGLSPNVRYSFSVLAVNGDDAATAPVSLGSKYTLANAPEELVLEEISMSGAEFYWDTSENSSDTYYSLRYATGTDPVTGALSHPISTHTSFTDRYTGNTAEVTGLHTSTSYYFEVSAQNGEGKVTSSTTLEGLVAFTPAGPSGAPAGSVGGTSDPEDTGVIAGILPSNIGVRMSIPSEAFGSETAIAIADSAEHHCNGGTLIPVEVAIFSQNNSQPQMPVTLVLDFDTGLRPQPDTAWNEINRNSDKVVLARYNEETQQCLPLETTISVGKKLVTATLNHFSIFQLMIRNAPSDLNAVKVFPNPFYPNRGQGYMTIDMVPARAKVTIYTLSGDKVWEGTAGTTGMILWRGVNNSGFRVASGIYLAVIESTGGKKVLKLAVER